MEMRGVFVKMIGNNIRNTYEMYAVIDSKGNTIATFRNKITAMSALWKLKKDYFTSDLKIVVVPEGK